MNDPSLGRKWVSGDSVSGGSLVRRVRKRSGRQKGRIGEKWKGESRMEV